MYQTYSTEGGKKMSNWINYLHEGPFRIVYNDYKSFFPTLSNQDNVQASLKNF